MNQFPTLVEYLLLNHDYVVIPGLGTFIAQQMDARWNEEEEAFLPPYRSVRFNTELPQTDDLLLKSMEEIFNLTPIQADQLLTTWLSDFNQMLEDNGCVEFGAMGDFTIEDDKTLLFTSQIAGVTTPAFYGLDAFHFSKTIPAPKAKIVPLAASMESDDKAIVIRINRRIANFVVTACAAVLLFMVFNLPMPENTALQQRSSALEWLIRNTEKNDVQQPVIANSQTETKQPASKLTLTTETATTEHPAKQSEAAPQAEEAANYCIVMASAISQANAERFVEHLNNDGFESARILKTGNMIRVVVGQYVTENEAANAARDIRQRSGKYRSAWVYRL